MRILFDESLPSKLTREFPEHHVDTVQRRGWAGLKNGALLRLAAEEFDVLLTGDKNMQYQQNLAILPIPVIVLIAASNRIEAMRPLVPGIKTALNDIQPARVVRVTRDP
jgi:predicted nuclease of predicted toxin-antitoxin system